MMEKSQTGSSSSPMGEIVGSSDNIPFFQCLDGGLISPMKSTSHFSNA
jgi:hypothetical protein